MGSEVSDFDKAMAEIRSKWLIRPALKDPLEDALEVLEADFFNELASTCGTSGTLNIASSFASLAFLASSFRLANQAAFS